MTEDQFVIDRLRAKPVNYKVAIRHYVSGGEWLMGVSVEDIAEMTDIERSRIAYDLRYAAELLEKTPQDGWLGAVKAKATRLRFEVIPNDHVDTHEGRKGVLPRSNLTVRLIRPDGGA